MPAFPLPARVYPLKTPAILAILLAAAFAAPTALASELPDADDAGDMVLPCGAILSVGVIPWTVCWVYVTVGVAEWGACTAWKLLWGPGAPCLTV